MLLKAPPVVNIYSNVIISSEYLLIKYTFQEFFTEIKYMHPKWNYKNLNYRPPVNLIVKKCPKKPHFWKIFSIFGAKSAPEGPIRKKKFLVCVYFGPNKPKITEPLKFENIMMSFNSSLKIWFKIWDFYLII